MNINGVDGSPTDPGTVTINAQTSKLQVFVSSTAKVAGSLNGNITVNGNGNTTYEVYDQNDPVAEPWLFPPRSFRRMDLPR